MDDKATHMTTKSSTEISDMPDGLNTLLKNRLKISHHCLGCIRIPSFKIQIILSYLPINILWPFVVFICNKIHNLRKAQCLQRFELFSIRYSEIFVLVSINCI